MSEITPIASKSTIGAPKGIKTTSNMIKAIVRNHAYSVKINNSKKPTFKSLLLLIIKLSEFTPAASKSTIGAQQSIKIRMTWNSFLNVFLSYIYNKKNEQNKNGPSKITTPTVKIDRWAQRTPGGLKKPTVKNSAYGVKIDKWAQRTPSKAAENPGPPLATKALTSI